MFLGCAFFAAGVFGLLIVELNSKHPLPILIWAPMLLVFISFSFLTLRSALRCRDRIAMDESGIWYVSNSHSVFIAWRELGSIRADDIGQRLVLQDVSRTRTIRV